MSRACWRCKLGPACRSLDPASGLFAPCSSATIDWEWVPQVGADDPPEHRSRLRWRGHLSYVGHHVRMQLLRGTDIRCLLRLRGLGLLLRGRPRKSWSIQWPPGKRIGAGCSFESSMCWHDSFPHGPGPTARRMASEWSSFTIARTGTELLMLRSL